MTPYIEVFGDVLRGALICEILQCLELGVVEQFGCHFGCIQGMVNEELNVLINFFLGPLRKLGRPFEVFLEGRMRL